MRMSMVASSVLPVERREAMSPVMSWKTSEREPKSDGEAEREKEVKRKREMGGWQEKERGTQS